MKFKFSDIHNESMYNTARVLFIAGKYSIFNNIVSDKLRGLCRGGLDLDVDNNELLSEFSISSHSSTTISNSIDFYEFLDVVKIPPVTGKWFCSVDYKMLSKKNKEQLERYMSKPSENGVLVVVVNELQDYRPLLRNKVINGHVNTHLIQLSYPNRLSLIGIVRQLMEGYNVKVCDKALELFVMRLGNNYDDYEQIIEMVCRDRGGSEVSYKDMVLSLEGIENYVIDDFIEELTNPIKSKKIRKNRKIYRILNSLLLEIGAKELVKKLRYKIDDIIEMRILINSGIVPVKVGFSVVEAKGRLEDEHKLKTINDYAFKRLALLASKSSLKDWAFIKMIINNINDVYNNAEYEKVLLCVIHRALLTPSRLVNDIGIANIIDEQLFDINTILLK